MFRLQAFHMYGVIGTAVAVAALSVFILKKYKVKTPICDSVYKILYKKGTPQLEMKLLSEKLK